MATSRPVFFVEQKFYYRKRDIQFEWRKGQDSLTWSQRSVDLIQSFNNQYPGLNILEISTKSWHSLGKACSALILADDKGRSVESVYQGSKVFENGGPYTDLYNKSSLDAKADPRIQNSGKVIKYTYDGKDYPLTPGTAFYNWLYLRHLANNPHLHESLNSWDGFTDIHYNPQKGLNTQANACAIFLILYRANLLKQSVESFEFFLNLVYQPDSIV